MRKAEKDPEEQRKRRLVQEEFQDHPRNPFDRFKNVLSRKNANTSSSRIEGNPLGRSFKSRIVASVSLATGACTVGLTHGGLIH